MSIFTAAPGQPETFQQFIGGAWVDAIDGQTVEVHNPYDDTLIATVPASTRKDMERAIAAAVTAQPSWAELAPAAKQQLFLRAADLLEERTADIVEALAVETGSGFGFAAFQIGWVSNLLRQAAGWVYLPNGEMLRSDFPHTLAYAERKPLGVVASFTPWNGAQVLAWRSVIAPLAAGNTVVVKPSELAPVTAGLVVAQVLEQAGFPPGTVNVVTHATDAAADVAEELYANPAVRCLYFTGSARVARIIGAKAAASLKRSVLELGGYNQIIVTEDADLDHAAKTVAFSAFFHQGQVCMNARRVLVHEAVATDFTAKLTAIAEMLPTGDPREQTTVIGPLITDSALNGAIHAVQEAIDAGATLITGGTHTGRVFTPTVLTNVPDHAALSHEETFGPIVVVRPVSSDDEAIVLVNDNSYGLAFSVLTGNVGRGMAIAGRIDSGAVHVNAPTINDEPQAPNGGVKDSGWGRSGLNGLDEFTEIRWMTVETEQRQLPL